MNSPLRIDETVKQYNLDETLCSKVVTLDAFIWRDTGFESIIELVAYERDYKKLSEGLGFCFDSEIGEFGHVDMKDGPMSLLEKGRFQQLAEGFNDNYVCNAYVSAGLTDLEALVLASFRADISKMYRYDAYHYGVPPSIQSLCNILNTALSKLPIYKDEIVRVCHEYDRTDFSVGDFFTPGFCLTTSTDLSWENFSKNRYRIKPLETESTKARALFGIENNGEYQVTFLQDASFRVMEINDWGNNKKEIVLQEINASIS